MTEPENTDHQARIIQLEDQEQDMLARFNRLQSMLFYAASEVESAIEILEARTRKEEP